jgi:protein-disulfide isomerase
MPELDRVYVQTGKVLFAFRHFPLPNHAFAERAAVAADCAEDQGRFWEMHDSLFRDQRNLDESSLIRRAADLRLDRVRFRSCLGENRDAQVRDDLVIGKTLQVRATPTFFVGVIQSDRTVKVRLRLSGAKPVDDFRKAVDQLLAVTQSDLKR